MTNDPVQSPVMGKTERQNQGMISEGGPVDEAPTTTHAWFSPGQALVHGSSVHRKLDGSTVNVTRMSLERQGKGSYRQDEKYVGEVIAASGGGCVQPLTLVHGISS